MNRALLALLIAVGCSALGYWAGDHQRNNAWLAAQAIQKEEARLALEAEVQRSQESAAHFLTESLALQTSYQSLEGKFHDLQKRGPLVVYRTVAPVGLATTTAEAATPGAAADAAVGLSLGAVWMWNSALTGSDTPAGACGAAATAEQACAADSGLSVTEAWANHTTNAKSCALDRQRLQHLIDFLTARP